jgi:acetyl/propionyl-CoA carboxylase alpha subunit
MADELNGRDGATRRRRALRVTFAPGSGPEAIREASTVVEVDPDGLAATRATSGRARLADVRPPRARLVLEAGAATPEADDQVLIAPLEDPVRSAAGIRRLEVVVDGWRFELDVDWESRARLRDRATSARAEQGRGGPSELRAIIPGRVVSVEVAVGDTVEPGARLLVLEAMKMQNEVKAPRAGTVARVAVGPGQTVELGDVLVVIE